MLITSIPQYIQGLTNAKIDLTADDVVTLYTAPSAADFNASIRDLILQSGEILKATAATANRLHVVASVQEFTKQRISTSAIL